MDRLARDEVIKKGIGLYSKNCELYQQICFAQSPDLYGILAPRIVGRLEGKVGGIV